MHTKSVVIFFTTLGLALAGAALGQAPANNNFGSATVLSGASGSANGDNTNATTQVGGGERTPFDDPENDNTVWFRWQAPQTGPVTFDLTGACFDTVMAIYTDTSLPTDATNLVGENDDGVDIGSTLTFNATANTVYRIQVAGLGGSGAGEEGAFPIAWLQTSAQGAIQFAIAEDSIGEPDGPLEIEVNRIGGTTGDVSVRFTTANGTATAGQDYTGFTGPGNTITFLDSDNTPQFISVPITNDGDFEGSETFTVTLSNPTGGAMLGLVTTFTATILSDELPQNDNFADVLTISGASGTVPGNDASATAESPGPEDALGPVVWFRWVAPSSGAVAFTVSSAAGHFVEMMRGPGLGALRTVGDGLPRRTDAVGIVQGATYYIAVGGGQDVFDLSWQTTSTGVFEFAGFRRTADLVTGIPAPGFVADEKGGTVTIAVRRTGALDGAVGVSFDAVEDTAGESGATNGVAGTDFTEASGTLQFADGESVRTFTVPIANNTTADGTRDFIVTLSSPTGGRCWGMWRGCGCRSSTMKTTRRTTTSRMRR